MANIQTNVILSLFLYLLIRRGAGTGAIILANSGTQFCHGVFFLKIVFFGIYVLSEIWGKNCFWAKIALFGIYVISEPEGNFNFPRHLGRRTSPNPNRALR